MYPHTITNKSLDNTKRPSDCSVVWLMNIQHSVNAHNCAACAREVIVARAPMAACNVHYRYYAA